LLISINNDSNIAVGSSIVDSLPIATPTPLGVMYGAPPVNNGNSSLSLGNSQAPGTWRKAIGNNVLTNAEGSTVGNVAIGSYNMQNLTTGKSNTAIGHMSMQNLTTGSNNVALGYNAGSSYGSSNGFQMGINNIAIGNFAGSGSNDTAVLKNIYIGPSTYTSATGVSNSIMLGTGQPRVSLMSL